MEGKNNQPEKHKEKRHVRKLILSALLSVGALSGMAVLPAAADANPPSHAAEAHFYASRSECGTAATGSAAHLPDRCDAEHAAQHLRHHGFNVQIVRGALLVS